MRSLVRAAGIVTTTFLLLLPLATAHSAEDGEEAGDTDTGIPSITGTAQDDVLDFEAIARLDGGSATPPRPGGPRAPHLTEFMRAGTCAATAGVVATPDQGRCAQTEPPPQCEPPATPVQPLWRRDRDSQSTPWGPWEMVTGWTCSTQPVPTELTPADFRRLPLAPPRIRIQPDTDQVLVNMPTITIAEAPDQTLTTTLLGVPVEVHATATTYTWDYGDGTTITTTSPGHPWPDHDVHHTYTHPGTYTITLTATWTGHWRITGTDTWLPVHGTATTTATHTPLTATEAHARLVADDCHTNPTSPGC